VHAPGLAGHSGIELTTVWARRREAAEELARGHGAGVSTSFEELLGEVDAVAFAVPPATQAELAFEAAKAGKHLILEKPVAPDVPTAERLAEAVSTAGAKGPQDMGKVMAMLKPRMSGRADMGKVSALVRGKLAG
jgi:predicted dehydrogenase